MPFPNHHACRLRDPGDFQKDSFRMMEREHEGKKYNVVMGKMMDDDMMTDQAFRYAKDTWEEDDAAEHCKDHDGAFEAASDENSVQPRNIERRFIPAELRVAKREDGAGDTIEGYAALFNSWTELWPGCREQIAPGAFADSLKDDVRCLFNHDVNYPLGRTTAGNLVLREDDKGLYMECKPTDTTFARDLLTNIAGGVVSQQSFAFTVDDEIWEYTGSGAGKVAERTLVKVRLYDVSPVTFPAYKDTTVALRSYERFAAAEVPVPAPVDLTAAGKEEDVRFSPDEDLEVSIRERKARSRAAANRG